LVIPCVERDRLWAVYDAALRELLFQVEMVISADGNPLDEASRRMEARVLVNHHRYAIREHCAEHKCDPNWLKAIGAE
jgi:hypothetical protein